MSGIPGIVHPTAVLTIPYVLSSAGYSFGVFNTISLIDTVPGEAHLISLTNLQVIIGAHTVLQINSQLLL